MIKFLATHSKKLALLVIVVFSVGLMATGGERFLKIAKSMEIFAKTYRLVNSDYVDETDANLLMRVALDSMLNALDPYTNFFSEAQMERVRINYKGFWDGVGFELIEHNNQFVVFDVFEESPAQKMGVKVGDILLEIDGAQIKGRALEDIEQTLHGKAGTSVKIKIKRTVSKKEEELTLLRDKINRKNVPYYAMLDENTAYIVLTTFTDRAGGNVADALKELQEKHKPKQVILDLRENGGGLLIEAVNLCNVFIPKGEPIVTTRNKISEWDRGFKTMNNPVDTDIPLIILMNDRSASASEIVAGAIQDLDRGLLVGRRSFGKGLVQNTYDIGYNSKVKLTTAKYYIPSGRCIQALEYKDGKSQLISDTLRKPFYTNKGRPVYDGGGLRPDYSVEADPTGPLLKSLVEGRNIFDYANYYHSIMDSIAGPETFKLGDKDFADFLAFLKKNNFSFKSDTEKALEELIELAKKDNTYEASASIFAKIQQSINAEKELEFKKFKVQILHLLEEEIVSRYYFERGKIQIRLKRDSDVQSAIQLFADKEKYKKLLQAPTRN